jgi:arsenate reductase
VTTVLFACIQNAGRSQMAAAFFNQLADPRKARALSGGTAPGKAVHPEVIEAMREAGLDLSSAVPQSLDQAIVQSPQVLITMGCGETCPLIPGATTLDWPIADPKGKPIGQVCSIRDEIRARVVGLLREHDWLLHHNSLHPPN